MTDLQIFIIALIAVGIFSYQRDAVHRYKKLLLMLSRLESAERMPDGNFYYIVPESKYNEMQRGNRND